VLADQDMDSVDGVFVDFFGKPAYTPKAPAKLVMASGASMVPIFMIRKKDNTYKMVIEKPILPDETGDREQQIKEYTQGYSSILEKYVREYPEQWVWVHSRWKSRPDDKK